MCGVMRIRRWLLTRELLLANPLVRTGGAPIRRGCRYHDDNRK